MGELAVWVLFGTGVSKGEVSERQPAAPDEDIPEVQVEPRADRALGSAGGSRDNDLGLWQLS